MEGIEFETDKSYAPDSYAQQETSSPYAPMMVRWLMGTGITDLATANYILIGMAGIGLGVTIFLYASALAEPKIDRVAEARAVLLMQSSR